MSALNPYNLGQFNSGTYSPIICQITAIEQDQYPIVTTAIDHSFVVGNEVQFFIPKGWGMAQLDQQKAYVISIPEPDQIVVTIDTTNFDAFVTFTPPNEFFVFNYPEVAGIGDINTGTSSIGNVPANPNTIPGAFQNQPP
jgi:hypothetical protein